MQGQPWYHEGLRFECLGCGECCGGSPGFVWVTQDEIGRLAAELGVEAHAFEAAYVRRVGPRRSLIELDGGDCVFLDRETRRCRVYRARPRQCRTWPFWRSNVRTPADWAYVCRICPGSGQGPVVPPEAIEASARPADNGP